jgi:hypothetical protein
LQRDALLFLTKKWAREETTHGFPSVKRGRKVKVGPKESRRTRERQKKKKKIKVE